MKLSPELSVRWYFPSRSMIIVCACCTMRMALDTYTRTTNPPTRMTSGKSEKGMTHVSLSTYRVVPSTRTTITRVPGSRGASMSDAARQSSPSTRTRPFPVVGSMRADTIPTFPASASTLVLISRPARCSTRSRKGRTPTSDSSVPAATARAGATTPGSTSETRPAASEPTATESSQNPGAIISATKSSRAAMNHTCHSCIAEKLAHLERRAEGRSRRLGTPDIPSPQPLASSPTGPPLGAPLPSVLPSIRGRRSHRDGALRRPASQPLLQLVQVRVDHRRHVQRDELGERQPAHDGDPEGTPGLGALAHAQRDRERAHERRHRGHHDGPKPDAARLEDRLARRLALRALRVEGEVDHHDAVLLHEPHEHDHAHEGVHAQLHPEQHQRDQRAEPGKRQGREDRDRVDEALVQDPEH